MSEKSPQPIHLSVHQRSNPSDISPTPDAEMYEHQEDQNGAAPDQENVDVVIPDLDDVIANKTLADDQTMTANRHAG